LKLEGISAMVIIGCLIKEDWKDWVRQKLPTKSEKVGIKSVEA